MPRLTFSKNERLSSLKEIDHLFKEGKSVTSAPIRLIWLESDAREITTPPIRVMFAAPKKKFAKAVDRNRIKRLMRESYRLEKNQLFEKIGAHQAYAMALMFTGNELPDFSTIQKALAHTLERWLKKITPTTPKT
jgi:ribonuclease P protein component